MCYIFEHGTRAHDARRRGLVRLDVTKAKENVWLIPGRETILYLLDCEGVKEERKSKERFLCGGLMI